MWKDYSFSYIKANRASSISIMAAALISAFFLSFLCSVFYNAWKYDIDSIIIKEGDWQARIVGDLSEEDLNIIAAFANVEKCSVNKELSEVNKLVFDIYFYNIRRIYQDIPLILDKLGLNEDAASYHKTLLSNYLINDPRDKQHPLLLPFYILILIIVSVSLILIISNSFAVTMRARIHQFGILSGIGATPKQIRTCLLQEALILSLIPVLLGSLLGIAASFGAMKGANILTDDITSRHEAVFYYNPVIFLITILISVLTVLLSAFKPARKLSKLTPLEAIRGTDFKLNKRRSSVIARLFGFEGELAANALKAQKKALRTASLSLTLAFSGFTLMLYAVSLSSISTRHTYFERYQSAWDEMVTIYDTRIEDFVKIDELRKIKGVRDLIVYQKAVSWVSVPQEWLSKELIELGGLEKLAGSAVSKNQEGWLVKAPIIIMDDQAFIKYCKDINLPSRLDGAIILNRIWDSINSNFRYAKYVPYVNENQDKVVIYNKENIKENAEIPIIGFTAQAPLLREEYDDYSLVHFLPSSLWEKISEKAEKVEKDTYVRILTNDGAALEDLNELEDNIKQVLGVSYAADMENRIQEKISNDKVINAYKLSIAAFCFLLALIGIANVFSNALGFIQQRRREFAQYMSVGLTPEGMVKMFVVEALLIAGRPLMITILITVPAAIFMTKVSYLAWSEVLTELPLLPVLCFALMIFAFVALAYYLGGKRILRCDLNEVLRNDTMI